MNQSHSAKLLGMTFESSQKWVEHIYGTGGLIPSLNQRLFFIRRLKNSIGPTALLKIAHGLFLSKLRYGLQLLGQVRWNSQDPLNKDLDAIQKCQNKLLRSLIGSNMSDHVSIKSMLVKFNILSVNQMNAQIKITEMWKSIHINEYPIKTNQIELQQNSTNTRARSSFLLQENKVSYKSEKTFLNDAIHIWNKCPGAIKECTTLRMAKNAIKAFVFSLPI